MTQSTPDEQREYRHVDITEGYDMWASRYDETPNPLMVIEEKAVAPFISDVTGKRAVDIGCGTGRYCVLLARRGAHVVGIDSSPGMLEQARQKIAPDCRFDVRCGTAETLDFPDEHFDLAVSAFTVGHLLTLEPVFTEAARVLKSGGQIVISDFHPYWVVSGHNYSEFFDKTGQQYRIPVYPHLIEEYWSIFKKVGLCLDDILEPTMSDSVLEKVPFAKHLKGIPMIVVFNLHKP